MGIVPGGRGLGHASRVPLVLYPLKNALLTPRTMVRRRKEKDLDPAFRRAFEYNRYRPAFYDFIGHMVAAPEMLIDFPLDETGTVFDVGTYDGSWAKALWDRSQPTIYAFEPAPGPYDRACEALAGRDRVHVLPYGLGAADASAALGLSAAGSSLFAEGTIGSVDVEIRDVVGVLDELGLERLDLIKLNIEGAEYDLFDRLIETGWLDRIDTVLVQFHEWQPHAYVRRRRIRRALASTHVEDWCHPWVWECWTRPSP
jgi:FkbM family methyltransferase